LLGGRDFKERGRGDLTPSLPPRREENLAVVMELYTGGEALNNLRLGLHRPSWSVKSEPQIHAQASQSVQIILAHPCRSGSNASVRCPALDGCVAPPGCRL
jgi:hypothetical protein